MGGKNKSDQKQICGETQKRSFFFFPPLSCSSAVLRLIHAACSTLVSSQPLALVRGRNPFCSTFGSSLFWSSSELLCLRQAGEQSRLCCPQSWPCIHASYSPLWCLPIPRQSSTSPFGPRSSVARGIQAGLVHSALSHLVAGLEEKEDVNTFCWDWLHSLSSQCAGCNQHESVLCCKGTQVFTFLTYHIKLISMY